LVFIRTLKIENLVKIQVESGLYNSSSEVVREALRLWSEQQQYKKWKYCAPDWNSPSKALYLTIFQWMI